jgi:hypothetical protein
MTGVYTGQGLRSDRRTQLRDQAHAVNDQAPHSQPDDIQMTALGIRTQSPEGTGGRVPSVW